MNQLKHIRFNMMEIDFDEDINVNQFDYLNEGSKNDSES
jgi:hypothetical protein